MIISYRRPADLAASPKAFCLRKPYSQAKYSRFLPENQIHQKSFRDFLQKIRFVKKAFEVSFGKSGSSKNLSRFPSENQV
ncbi:MAG: hypothetical protein LBD21_09175, partial [Tannerellaceae bacterium]|nr:hypothetical protein [Tannerellaceae bacterium]